MSSSTVTPPTICPYAVRVQPTQCRMVCPKCESYLASPSSIVAVADSTNPELDEEDWEEPNWYDEQTEYYEEEDDEDYEEEEGGEDYEEDYDLEDPDQYDPTGPDEVADLINDS